MKDVVIILLVFLHTFISINLLSRIFKKPKHYWLFNILISCINTFLGYIAFSVFNSHSWYDYLITIGLFLVEMLLLFRVYPMGIVTAVSGVYLHSFTIRSVVMSLMAATNDISMSEVVNDPDMFFQFTVIVLSIHILFLLIFMFAIPPKYLSAVVENINLLGFMALITVSLTVYLSLNALIFDIDQNIPLLNMQQLLLPTFFLGLFYFALLMTIKIVIFQNYQKLNKTLEDKIAKDDSIKRAFFKMTDIFVDVNCSDDKILRLIINGDETPADSLPPCSQFWLNNTMKFVHSDDLASAMSCIPEKVIESFENGILEMGYDFRTKVFDSEKKIGSPRYLWHRMKVISSKDELTGKIYAVYTADEIHDEKEKELDLQKRAERDPLTGAYNKAGIEKHVKKHLDNDGVGSMFMFDLDNFKGINDNMGHVAGDNVLVEIYDDLCKIFRSKDIIARVGGDEFVVFMIDENHDEIIERKATAICQTLERTYKAENGVDIKISSSVGVAIAPTDSQEYETLLKASDIAMYASKRKGKNTFTIYDNELHNAYHPQEIEAYQRRER